MRKALCIICFILICVFKSTNITDTYTTAGTIIETNIIETVNGNIWACETSMEPGTDVFVTFNGNNTMDIEDDEILMIEAR